MREDAVAEQLVVLVDGVAGDYAFLFHALDAVVRSGGGDAELSRFKCEPDPEYCEAAEEVLDIALSDNRSRLTDAIMRMVWKRNFIG